MDNLTVFNTVLFCLAPLLVMLLLADEDEDDGPGGGTLQPAYERN